MKTGCSDDTVRGARALAGVVAAAQGGRCRSLRLQREPSWTSRCSRCLVRGPPLRFLKEARCAFSCCMAPIQAQDTSDHAPTAHTHDDGRRHRERRRRPREKQTRRAQRRDTRAKPHRTPSRQPKSVGRSCLLYAALCMMNDRGDEMRS